MKRIAFFLCFILISHALIHAKEAMLFIKKLDDTQVSGKLLELSDKELELLTVNSIKVAVQVKDIVSFSYHLDKRRSWGKVLLGGAIGGSFGLIMAGTYEGQEKPTYTLFYSVSGVALGIAVSTLAVLAGKQKKTGKVFLKGLSHKQKLKELRKFRKYALVRY